MHHNCVSRGTIADNSKVMEDFMKVHKGPQQKEDIDEEKVLLEGVGLGQQFCTHCKKGLASCCG
jgi:hypothetical protein